jgi:hypothetical protein
MLWLMVQSTMIVAEVEILSNGWIELELALFALLFFLYLFVCVRWFVWYRL